MKLIINKKCPYCKESVNVMIKSVVKNGGELEIEHRSKGVFPELELKNGFKLKGLNEIKELFD